MKHRGRQRLERVRRVLADLFRRFRLPDEQPGDPYAGVRQPLKPGPKGRSGAVALDEPPAGR
ncbi:MAG TPA: hypothetical protein DEH78_17750 [Solibacterales bacterium]|nr:hypothetical protein [Bryobacterales bacterium]